MVKHNVEIAGIVRETWSTALDRPNLEESSDFFVAGGHSLVASRMMYILRERLGTKISMRTLFENPTLGAFTNAVCQKMSLDGEEFID
ncbi:phosphopantetheine-binding protein (plasmid) [Glutamicibacter sp. FR1]|uniref:phosphopantetheine-binding protein n=1 Tax=Glutamicibacter sp. FR1 TaxID=3393744 RepID=UPI0039AEE6E3